MEALETTNSHLDRLLTTGLAAASRF